MLTRAIFSWEERHAKLYYDKTIGLLIMALNKMLIVIVIVTVIMKIILLAIVTVIVIVRQ